MFLSLSLQGTPWRARAASGYRPPAVGRGRRPSGTMNRSMHTVRKDRRLSANPLLAPPFAIPFEAIRAEHVEPAVSRHLAVASEALEDIAAASAPPTWDNLFGALERATEPLDLAMEIVSHLESVRTTPALRDAYNRVLPDVSRFHSRLTLHPGLFARLEAYAATAEAAALDPVRARLLRKTLDDFRREGAALPPEAKARLEQINERLSEATTAFSQHVLDATTAFALTVTDPARLAGLPESAVAAARAAAEQKGEAGWRFTLHAPSLTAVLTYADDADLRRELYLAHTTRAAGGDHDNRALIGEILALRAEKARLLGFDDFADYVLADRMARDGATARRFVADLEVRSRPYYERENAELAAFVQERGGPARLEPWDWGYWAEKQRLALHDFDDEALRPWFSMDRVFAGMFEIAETLFEIEIREIPVGAPDRPATWHPDVRVFRVDGPDGRGGRAHVASFYADFFPRDDKRGGAWMGHFITGRPTADGFAPHLGVICGNMTPPLGDRPALLTHDEVQTVFHEFGHLLHQALSRVPEKALAGTHVAWDFVELPSQIMENWCWERTALDKFARHVDDGSPIPDDLYARMIGARNFRSANAMMRQLGFATLDLALHVDYDASRDGDPVEYARRIQQRFTPATLREDYAMICGFTHLFAGAVAYAAGYYSYKWAEVLDADAFRRFEREGVLSPAVGAAFREAILARGDSAEPAELYREFMGRDPDPEALMIRSGLTS